MKELAPSPSFSSPGTSSQIGRGLGRLTPRRKEETPDRQVGTSRSTAGSSLLRPNSDRVWRESAILTPAEPQTPSSLCFPSSKVTTELEGVPSETEGGESRIQIPKFVKINFDWHKPRDTLKSILPKPTQPQILHLHFHPKKHTPHGIPADTSYTHAHTCLHTRSHTHTRARSHDVLTHMHTHAHTQARTHAHMHTHAHRLAHMHTHAHTHVHTPSRTYAHTRSHARAHPHAHARPRTQTGEPSTVWVCLPSRTLLQVAHW